MRALVLAGMRLAHVDDQERRFRVLACELLHSGYAVGEDRTRVGPELQHDGTAVQITQPHAVAREVREDKVGRRLVYVGPSCSQRAYSGCSSAKSYAA